jgi:hypothetical protein
MNDDKNLEYRQVAALVCEDIEIAYKCAQRWPDKALEFFKDLKEKKDKAIADPAWRKMRYDAANMLYGLRVSSQYHERGESDADDSI